MFVREESHGGLGIGFAEDNAVNAVFVCGEVHLDIYDDRLSVTSPGGMYNGMLIQDLDIADISSERRNPILANVMAQLDYMEKRGSGLTRICNETKALDGYKDELKPIFKSTPSQFQTIIFVAIGMQNDGDVSETKLTERQQKILDIIKMSPTISGRRMSEILSVRHLRTAQKLNSIYFHKAAHEDHTFWAAFILCRAK